MEVPAFVGDVFQLTDGFDLVSARTCTRFKKILGAYLHLTQIKKKYSNAIDAYNKFYLALRGHSIFSIKLKVL
jgi:hypothetical protein